jgi:hypothetical protein
MVRCDTRDLYPCGHCDIHFFHLLLHKATFKRGLVEFVLKKSRKQMLDQPWLNV